MPNVRNLLNMTLSKNFKRFCRRYKENGGCKLVVEVICCL